MLAAAEKATSGASRYLIAARTVRSALDHAVRPAEKMVAYPDLINATGPDFREPLHSSRLNNQTMVPPSFQGDSSEDLGREGS